MLTAIREVQVPLVAVMLLGACLAKLVRATRIHSIDAGLGPTALFPLRLRKPVAVAVFAIELGLGAGLIVTAGPHGRGAPATCVRLGAGLLFLVATSTLIELRANRPEVGCGCFGDFSTSPVSLRSIARAALLAAAALSTIGLAPFKPHAFGSSAGQLLTIQGVELLLLGALSPEIGEALVRLGYSEPCELREVPPERTIAALHRSKAWRRQTGLISGERPVDMWRELCWRYVVYPCRYPGQQAEIVFAVSLQKRRPPVRAAVVDALTSELLPWPDQPGAQWRVRPGLGVPVLAAPTAPPPINGTSQGDMPLSTDV